MKLVKRVETGDAPIILALPANTVVVMADEPETGNVVLYIHPPSGFDFDDAQTVADELSVCLGNK